MSSKPVKPKDFIKSRATRRNEAITGYLTIGVIVFIIFILGGGIYDIIENPPALLQGSSGFIAIHPYMGEQTINESLFSMIMFGLAFIGLLLCYRSTKILYDRSKANTQMLIGLGLAMLGVAGCYVLYYLKG